MTRVSKKTARRKKANKCAEPGCPYRTHYTYCGRHEPRDQRQKRDIKPPRAR